MFAGGLAGNNNLYCVGICHCTIEALSPHDERTCIQIKSTAAIDNGLCLIVRVAVVLANVGGISSVPNGDMINSAQHPLLIAGGLFYMGECVVFQFDA